MTTVSFRDKILCHLYRYRLVKKNEDYRAPLEITQDGIAMAVNTSRSHVSVMVARMIEAQLITKNTAYIRNSRRVSKRLVYYLTETGKNEYFRRVAELREEGIDLENMDLSVKDCRYDDIKRIASDRLDDVAGLLFLRAQVRKAEIHDSLPLIVFDHSGKIHEKEVLREALINNCTAEEYRRWHSRAADWSIEVGADIRDRLYHLKEAGRHREAIRVIKDMRFFLMDNADPDLSDTVFALAQDHDDPELLSISARMALRAGRLESAEKICSKRASYDGPLSGSFMSEILLRNDMNAVALEVAENAYRGDTETGIALGMCLLENGRAEEAIRCLEDTRRQMVDSGCVFRMDDLLFYEALAESKLNRVDSAAQLAKTGISLSRNRKRRSQLVALNDKLKAS